EDTGSGQSVEVSFALLTLPRVWVRGNVIWKKPKHSFGVRFDATDDRRRKLKEWIDAYLEGEAADSSQPSAISCRLSALPTPCCCEPGSPLRVKNGPPFTMST